MATEKEQALIDDIKAKGITPPEHLTEEQLVECLMLAEDGASQRQVDKQFPKPKVSAPEPTKASVAEPEAPLPAGIPAEQVAKMVADAAAKAAEVAVAAYIKSQPPQEPVAAVQQHTERVIEREVKEVKKPWKFDTRNVGDEDFMPMQFRVLHLGYTHSFDKFKIGGRRVDPPYSTFIYFNPYNGSETNRYGSANDVVVLCVYETHSKKEKEMFLSDERWGGEFWSPEMVTVDDELELMIIMTRALSGLESYPMDQIKEMAQERGIKTTNLQQMRAEIARIEAKRQQVTEKKIREAAAASRKKEELMIAGQAR